MIPSPTVVNRGMILAVGRYGVRALAHIWPRLRFEDYQRKHLRPDIPSLRRLLSLSLILPDAGGGFVAGSPDAQQWDSDIFIQKIIRLVSRPWAVTNELEDTEHSTLIGGLNNDSIVKGIGSEAGSGREWYFRTALDTDTLRDHILHVASQALVDEDAPGSEVNRFTVYLIASLADHFATPLLWPLVMLAREQLESHLPLEVVGLLSTGAYGNKDELRDQRARIHVALRELDRFSQVTPDLAPFELFTKHECWRDQCYFDHCFLLDSQKQNGTLARDEDEIVVASGNILEVLVLSDALEVMAEQIGPDQELFHRQGPFSTAGTASLYVPLDEWRARNRAQFVLEILQDEFLNSIGREDVAQAETIAETADQFIANHLDLARLTQQMVQNCPLDVARRVHPRRENRSVEHLLSQAGQDKPILSQDGPGQPVPEVEVTPDAIRVRFGRQEGTGPIPPDGWLRHLYLHYRRLGLDPPRIFPGDPEAVDFEGDWPVDPQPRTYFQEWFEAMLLACDSRNAQDLVREDESVALGLPAPIPAGIVPGFQRQLRNEVILFLRRNNQGLLASLRFLERLSSHMRENVNQLDDYRTRLARAMSSIEEVRNQEQAAPRRLGFRRLLSRRPRAGGLLTRSVMLGALLAVVTFYGVVGVPVLDYLPQHPVTTWIQQHAYQLWPSLSLGAGLMPAVIAALLIFGVHRFRLCRAIRAIERDLARQLNLQVNREIVRLLFEDNLGLLADLSLSLAAQRKAIEEAIETLRQWVSDLEQDLSESPGMRRSFIREALPGLEDLRQRLVQESRPHMGAIPSTLLVADPGEAAQWLDGILGHDTELAMLRMEAAETTSLEIAGHYRQVTEKYASLGDLILATVGRFADQVGDIVPSPDLKITTLVQERIPGFTPRTFLADLSQRAQVMLNWEPEDIQRGMPIPLDLVSTQEATRFTPFLPAATEQELRAVSSFDPFAMTILRLRYGLRLSAVPRLRACEDAFRALGDGERADLVVAKQSLSEDGDYLGED